jgi:hypothetical protein
VRREFLALSRYVSSHSLAVAAFCVLTALVAGPGMSPFVGTERTSTRDVARPDAGLQRSTDVLNRWLQPVLPASPDESPPAPAAHDLLRSRPLPLTVVMGGSLGVGGAVGDIAGEARAAARTRYGTPTLMPGDRPIVTLSFYYCEESAGTLARGDGGGFCGRMRDGSFVRPGAAACDVVYLGQKFRIIGDPNARTYVCADTGSAVHGMHRDIWFLDNQSGWVWQSRVGRSAVIEILP